MTVGKIVWSLERERRKEKRKEEERRKEREGNRERERERERQRDYHPLLGKYQLTSGCEIKHY